MEDENEIKRKMDCLLVVDDDPGMTETLVDIFSDMGYCADAAPDGYTAVEMVKKKTYSLVLIDIKMPGMNGIETFKELKKISPSVRAIMMTAYSVESLVREALDNGAVAVMYKPLDIRKLKQLIDKMYE